MKELDFPESKAHLPFEVVVAVGHRLEAIAILSQCALELNVIKGQYQQLDVDLYGFELKEDCKKYTQYLDHFGIDYEADT